MLPLALSRVHTCGAHIFSLISSAALGPSGYSCAHVLGVRFPLCSAALIESLIASTLRGLQFLCRARPDELAVQEGEARGRWGLRHTELLLSISPAAVRQPPEWLKEFFCPAPDGRMPRDRDQHSSARPKRRICAAARQLLSFISSVNHLFLFSNHPQR